MAEVINRPSNVIKRLAEDAQRIEDYIKSGDESKKPAGIKFVDPFNIPRRKKRG